MAAGSVGKHISGELDARNYDTGDFKRTAGAFKALGIVHDNMILLLYKYVRMEANPVLQTNWPAVVELAELLLAQGRVEGSDVREMVGTHRARSARI
jgi:hypothetical protein